jgi:hypothetical protein
LDVKRYTSRGLVVGWFARLNLRYFKIGAAAAFEHAAAALASRRSSITSNGMMTMVGNASIQIRIRLPGWRVVKFMKFIHQLERFMPDARFPRFARFARFARLARSSRS